MARPLRIEFEGAFYHLSGRGNRRERIFEDDRDRERFVSLLAESARRYQGEVHAFVLMENHYHVLARTQLANLGRWMHWLTTSYSVYFNRRHGRVGHLFQGRYKSIVVEEGTYLLELSRYIHLNPVRGKVLGQGDLMERRKRLRAWHWSSYRGYAGLTGSWPFLNESAVLGELDGSKADRRWEYRKHVEARLMDPQSNPLEAAKWQAILGSEDFLQRMKDRMQAMQEGGREVRALREQRVGCRSEAKIICRAAEIYGMKYEQLTAPRARGEAVGAAMTLVWERCGLSLKEIGKIFGGADYAAVAQRIRRYKERNSTGGLDIPLATLEEKCQII